MNTAERAIGGGGGRFIFYYAFVVNFEAFWREKQALEIRTADRI